MTKHTSLPIPALKHSVDALCDKLKSVFVHVEPSMCSAEPTYEPVLFLLLHLFIIIAIISCLWSCKQAQDEQTVIGHQVAKRLFVMILIP